MVQPPLPFTAIDDDELAELASRIERDISGLLAPYEPQSATLAWFDTLRAIEECINLPMHDWTDEGVEERLYAFPVPTLLSDPSGLREVRSLLAAEFSETIANRFVQLLVRAAGMAPVLAAAGLSVAASGLGTVGSMIGYLMSRRRHFVALLHALPLACRGRQIVKPIETFACFLPTIETRTMQLVGAQQALLVSASRRALGLDAGAELELAMLDPMFLDPERSRITEVPITDAGLAMLSRKEALEPDRLFSAAELRNDVLAMEAAYAEFDLADTQFAQAAELARRLSHDFVERDFWIAIGPERLDALTAELSLSQALRSALVHSDASFAGCLSTYAPLVLVGGVYRSTVTLVSRFMYYWRSVSLERNKRFQIRSGFIFEKAVASALGEQGFDVKDITRVSRHEFDVVTTRAGTVWNVQCKNNFLDLERLQEDPVRFARYNRRLVRSYGRALVKERDRERLLLQKLSLGEIRHMVVSRFPVLTDDPRIVPYSRIAEFAAVADRLEAFARSMLR